METLTGNLVEAHLMSFIEIASAAQGDGVTRWAWRLSPMAGQRYDHRADDDFEEFREMCGLERKPLNPGDDFSFEYSTREAARNFAIGWIRRNRRDIERAAVTEARAGIRYRATGHP